MEFSFVGIILLVLLSRIKAPIVKVWVLFINLRFVSCLLSRIGRLVVQGALLIAKADPSRENKWRITFLAAVDEGAEHFAFTTKKNRPGVPKFLS